MRRGWHPWSCWLLQPMHGLGGLLRRSEMSERQARLAIACDVVLLLTKATPCVAGRARLTWGSKYGRDKDACMCLAAGALRTDTYTHGCGGDDNTVNHAHVDA